MSVTLPNEAKPGQFLTLSVRGEDEPYKFTVPDHGFGGRTITCQMPQPPEDNARAMHRLMPVCDLSNPPDMACPVSDMWLAGKGGGLHKKLRAGEFRALLDTIDGYHSAHIRVQAKERLRDTLRDREKKANDHLKELAKAAKREHDFWDMSWPRTKSVISGAPGKCYSRMAHWMNATRDLEQEVKSFFQKELKEAGELLQRVRASSDEYLHCDNSFLHAFPGVAYNGLDCVAGRKSPSETGSAKKGWISMTVTPGAAPSCTGLRPRGMI